MCVYVCVRVRVCVCALLPHRRCGVHDAVLEQPLLKA